jgi:hypothetical protein
LVRDRLEPVLLRQGGQVVNGNPLTVGVGRGG